MEEGVTQNWMRPKITIDLFCSCLQQCSFTAELLAIETLLMPATVCLMTAMLLTTFALLIDRNAVTECKISRHLRNMFVDGIYLPCPSFFLQDLPLHPRTIN